MRLVAVSASAYDLVIAGSFSACVSSGLPQVSEIRLTHPRGQFHRTPGALDVKVADLGDLFLCHAVADFPAEFRLRLDVSTATLPVPAQIQQLGPHASADYAVVVDGQTLRTLYAGATGALDYVAAPTGTSSSGTSTPDCRRRIIPCEE